MNPLAVSRALDFAQEVLAARRDGETIETFIQTCATTKVHFEANKLKDATVREARGLMVRLRDANGRLGSFATSDFSDAAATIEMARSLALLGEPAEFDIPDTFEPADVITSTPEAEARTPELLVAAGERVLAGLREGLPAGLHTLELFNTLTTIEIANSAGAHARYAHSDYSGYLVTSITKLDDQLEAYELFQSSSEGTDFEGPLKRMIQKVTGCEVLAKIPSGNYPVIFTPNALGTFHALTNALNGKPVVEGLSTFRDALGQQALSKLITITDDPTVSEGPMSYPIDDEGVSARAKTLVDRGSSPASFTTCATVSGAAPDPPATASAADAPRSAPVAATRTTSFPTPPIRSSGLAIRPSRSSSRAFRAGSSSTA